MGRKVLIVSLFALLIEIGLGADPADHWAFRAPESPAIPPVRNTEWPRSDLDHFILARLESENLEPVADADADTLVRRLCFNLTGLPPTPEEAEAFRRAHEKDSATAITTLVDRLVSSPRFGEKWARHWLDLARYAETNGKDRNVVFAHAWRYRDWVIEAFNSDLPYDQFVREQIAGDLLEGAGDSQLIATGFLTLGPKAFQEKEREKFVMDMIDEQIDVTTRSILGLTVACARCHDHKFDPVSQADYYALAGIFLSSDTLHGPGPLYFQSHKHDMPVVAIGPDAKDLEPGVETWRKTIYDLTIKVMSLRSAGYKIRRVVTGTLRERGLKKPEDDPELLKKHEESEAMYAEAEQLLKKRDELFEKVPPRPAYAMAMRDSEVPEDCRIRIRGEFNNSGDSVSRGDLAIPGMPLLDQVGKDQSGRAQLADWLTSPENPLTVRVFVNRVWHQLFGRGLVATVDNFGLTGESPSHPELLDYLARKFVEEDQWSMRKLIRRIVLSRTWQLASHGGRAAHWESDPGNHLLWRASLRRLDIEALRDAILAISGELKTKPPGPSPLAEVFLGKEYGTSGNRVELTAELAANRNRTVYLPIVRNEIPELLKLFDFADTNAVTGARNDRTIPSQALYLMNSPFVEEQAHAAAVRLLESEPENDGAALQQAFRWTVNADPAAEAQARANTFLDERRSELIGTGKSREDAAIEAWTDLFQTLFAGAEFRYLR